MWNIFFFNIFLTIKRIFFQLRQKFLFTKRVDIVIIIKNIKDITNKNLSKTETKNSHCSLDSSSCLSLINMVNNYF